MSADASGAGVHAAVVAVVAAHAGAVAGPAAALVHLWADDAITRTSVDGEGSQPTLDAGVDGTELVIGLGGRRQAQRQQLLAMLPDRPDPG